MDNSKEYIVAAAYKVKPELKWTKKKLIYKHSSLWRMDCVPEFDDIYNIRIARRHAEILNMFLGEVDQHTDGFYTSYGRWVDRYDAARIAIECGQCEKGTLIMDNKLDSSDIFK